jgi:hypothetical protein
MFRSLRSILILPWLFVAFVCCALTFPLLGLMELGIGGEIGKAKNSVTESAERIKQELELYLNGFSEAPVNFDDSDRQREFQRFTKRFVVIDNQDSRHGSGN